MHANKNSFTRESTQDNLLWQQRVEGFFATTTNKKLFWMSLQHPERKPALIIVTGRAESSYKYKKQILLFYKQGFNVYIFDHLGQGFSDRITTDYELGHIDSFATYIDDLNSFFNFVCQKNNLDKNYMLAHSMGGLIAALWLEKYPDKCNGAVLSSPMLGLKIPSFYKPFIKYIFFVANKLYKKPRYLWGHTNYKVVAFTQNNQVTHSEELYNKYKIDLIKKHPKLRLGGPSINWVATSYNATKEALVNAAKLKTPLLILQAGNELVVNNHSQNNFFNKLRKYNTKATLIKIEHAKHELLFEDEIFQKDLFKYIFNHFSSF